MPTVLNEFNRPSNVHPDLLDEVLARGTCRLASEADRTNWPWAVPYIHDTARWSIDRPVIVRGAGPSAHAPCDAYSLCVNPRSDGPRGDAVFAIDRQYWDMQVWRDWVGDNEGAIAFWVNTNHETMPPSETFAYQVIPPCPRFKGFGEHRWACLDEHGTMWRCFYSSIAAVLIAQYLTHHPVILAGVDLDGFCYRDRGDTQKAVSYEAEQLPEWKAAAHNLENVYCHPDMGGPLRDIFPTWKGTA